MSTRDRVDSLENALKELAYAGRRTEMSNDRLSERVNRTTENLDRFSDQTRESLNQLSAELLDLLTSHGCYAMMLGDETMDLVNFDAVSKRR